MLALSSPGSWTRRDVLKSLAAAGIGVGVGAADHGYFYQRQHLTVTRQAIPVSGLAETLSGLRIGFLTDLHRSDTVTHAMAAAAVQALLAEDPDLIVLGGDYVTWGGGRARHFVAPAADALAPLRARHGVFAILGNHDDDHDMPMALTRNGFTVLRDSRTRIDVRGESLDIAGIRFWTRKAVDIARVIRGASTNLILLAHTPSRLPEAVSLAVPLMLSGHTHGGQIVLPGLGAIAAREFPVVEGLARRQGTSVFVSRGVGTVYLPIRLNCPPEIAILTLEPGQPLA
jgi:predicted MPP superfamily phosphohydrolase